MWWTSPFHKSPCSLLLCSSSQAKTESCSAPRSRFLATLIVEQLAEVPTNVFQDRIQQRTLEQIADTPVPQVVVVLVDIFTHFSLTGFSSVLAELIFETLAISFAEKIGERACSARHMLTPCVRHMTWKLDRQRSSST